MEQMEFDLVIDEIQHNANLPDRPEPEAAEQDSPCSSCKPVPSRLWQAVSEKDVDLVLSMSEEISSYVLEQRYCPSMFYCSQACYNPIQNLPTGTDHTFLSSMSVLHFAVTRGELTIINHLIDMGAKLDARDNRGNNLLQYSVERQNYAVTQLLVTRGANVNAPANNTSENSLLHMATSMGSVELVEFLLQRGVDPRAKTSWGWTAMHFAICATCENPEVIHRLVDGGVPIDELSEEGHTPLHLAVKSKKLDTLKLLLRRNADPCKRTRKGNIPLMMAVKRDQLSIVKLLLQYKASPNDIKPRKPSMLQVACNLGHESIALELIEAGANLTVVNQNGTHVIHSVIKSGMLSVIKKVLSKIPPATVNAKDYRGYTPLLWACKKADMESVKLLLDHGACVTDVTKMKENVLHCLALSTYSEDIIVKIATYLLDRGVTPINKFDKKGFTPFHVACIKNKLTLIKLFSKRGAKIHRRTHSGSSPLMLIVKNGNYESVVFFLKRGSRINEVCRSTGTALHLACKQELRHTIQVLLDFGADINILNSSNCTPFSQVNQQYIFESCRIMIRHIGKMTIRGEHVNEGDMRTIDASSTMREFYEDCLAELRVMQMTHFYGTMTWLDLLLMPRVRMENLYKNRMFMEMAEVPIHENPYPLYSRELHANFVRLRMKRTIFEEAKRLVFSTFPVYLPEEIMLYIAELTVQEDIDKIDSTRTYHIF